MLQKSAESGPHRSVSRLIRFSASLLLMAPCLLAQQAGSAEQPADQPYVGRFVVYAGFLHLDSPKISLYEPGIHIQAGMRWSRHVSLGFDYSRGTGNTIIGLNQAATAIQQTYGPLLQQLIAAGALPANYVAALPFSSVTQTFTAGPESVKELERRLRVSDIVLKFLTVRIDQTLKRLEKRKKDRDKRAARRAASAPPPSVPGPGAAAGPGLPVQHVVTEAPVVPGLPKES